MRNAEPLPGCAIRVSSFPFRKRDLPMAGNHQRQAKVVSKISLPGPRQHRFPNPPRAPLHARPILGNRLNGRFGNLGFQKRSAKAVARLRRNLASEVMFCFPAWRFHVFLPYRHQRHCGAPKPGKEKQKSYNYCSAILMVHRFQSFLSVFTQVMRKMGREVTRKMA